MLLQFLAVPVLIGLAQMVVLAVGQLNLAVGAVGGFAAVAMGVLMADHGVPVPLALLIGFLLASLVGLVNGLLVVLTRINGFIVTLATMTVLLGVAVPPGRDPHGRRLSAGPEETSARTPCSACCR